ncbi:hypothetical protein HOD75_02395 [archaeon]|jgi:hypothetical protein|nr:hypothetical protein [archaeon]MBT4241728.1 hypothetical protein [archaeon]MBT4418276.1 hypothetical protein [archaeon]
MEKTKKGAIELDTLGWMIIAVLVLVIVVVGIIVLGGKGEGMIEFIKNIFRFGVE